MFDQKAVIQFLEAMRGDDLFRKQSLHYYHNRSIPATLNIPGPHRHELTALFNEPFAAGEGDLPEMFRASVAHMICMFFGTYFRWTYFNWLCDRAKSAGVAPVYVTLTDTGIKLMSEGPIPLPATKDMVFKATPIEIGGPDRTYMYFSNPLAPGRAFTCLPTNGYILVTDKSPEEAENAWQSTILVGNAHRIMSGESLMLEASDKMSQREFLMYTNVDPDKIPRVMLELLAEKLSMTPDELLVNLRKWKFGAGEGPDLGKGDY